MKTGIIHIGCTVLFLLIFGLLSSQSTIGAAGGQALGSGGEVSFTVGQVAQMTMDDDEYQLVEGVQQVFDLSLGTADKGDEPLKCILYPNPVSDDIILTIEGQLPSYPDELNIELFDQEGKCLMQSVIDGKQTTISLQGLPPAPYYLRLIAGKGDIKIFKLIKT